jgi:hypothetical protein
MEWRFKQLTRNDTLTNPNHLEFFHSDALNSAADALAREDVQNRLDARVRNGPRVEVRYRLCGPASPEAYKEWFSGLKPHLDSADTVEEIGKAPDMSQPLQWLVIEDFGTTGLEGDPACFQDPAPGASRNDYFWFIRNVGRSGKKGGDRGRWGLGKIVYPAASQIRSVLAYTVRHSDGKGLLCGRSVLALHYVGNEQFDSEGYWGRFDDPQHEYFAMPETDSATLVRFASDFKIQRKPGEPGLSLVIPWADPEITFDALVHSLVEHWFWVLLEDRLVVKVAIDASGHEIVLSRDTLESVVKEIVGGETARGQQLLRKIQFASAVQDFDWSGPTSFSLKLCENGAPKWDDADKRFPSPEDLEKARAAYRSGQILAFEVPVKVRRTGGIVDDVDAFDVYVQRSDTADAAAETFLRDGMTISGLRYLREPGARALTMAEEGALGTLLGDAENPAHTRWERGGKHFKGKYHHGPAILLYVQKAAQHLCSLLARKQDGPDLELLKHLFSVIEPGAGGQGAKPKPKPPVPPPPLPPIPPNYFVECTKIVGGFRLRPHPKALRAPTAIQLRTAYEVIRGNPFKLHHPADFDLTKNGIKIDSRGMTIVPLAPNRLRLDIAEGDFEFTATGFDSRRDLIVDVKPIHEGSVDDDSAATHESEEVAE